MGSYGSLVSDHRTQERFHLGVKDLKVGLANSMCLMISDRFSSDPMTLPLPPPNFRVFDMAALYPLMVEGE